MSEGPRKSLLISYHYQHKYEALKGKYVFNGEASGDIIQLLKLNNIASLKFVTKIRVQHNKCVGTKHAGWNVSKDFKGCELNLLECDVTKSTYWGFFVK